MNLKLLLDENISPQVFSVLQSHNYDIKSARENFKGRADEEIAKIAIEEARTIITYDLYFGELYRNFGASSIILRLRSKKSSNIIERLLRFLKQIEESNIDLTGKLAVLTEGRVRIVGE